MPRCTRSCLSWTLGLYTCNVIVAGMSKRGYVNTILGKLHKLKYAILTSHNTYLGHTGFVRSFQEWKARLVKIGQTAHKLETNAHANFPTAENLAYQCMENGGRNIRTLIFLWLTVAFRYNIETN